MTQIQQILKHMREKGSISTMEAFNDFGITRLASRIHEITQMGIGIERETVSSKNRYGETVRYVRYRLV